MFYILHIFHVPEYKFCTTMYVRKMSRFHDFPHVPGDDQALLPYLIVYVLHTTSFPTGSTQRQLHSHLQPTPSTEPPLLWGDCFLEISCLGAQGRPINFVFDDDFELRFAITEYTLIE